MSSTKYDKHSFTIKMFSIFIIIVILFFSYFAALNIKNIQTEYSASQFQPKEHQLLKQDAEIHKIYGLNSLSPHIVLLQLPKGKSWLDNDHFNQISKLTAAIAEISKVKDVLSLSNIDTAVVDNDSFYTGKLHEVIHEEDQKSKILKNPLLTPQLITKNSRSTIIIVTPKKISMESHTLLVEQIRTLASVYTPNAKYKIGGPAAIRTNVSNLLSKEILTFVGLSLIGAILVLIFVFRGWWALPTTLFIISVANIMALGVMAYLDVAFTVLSTTIPILVTITVSAISTHTLVRLGEHIKDEQDYNLDIHPNEMKFDAIFKIMKDLIGPHLLTAITTVVGFATLTLSSVPLIKEYGLAVSSVIPVAAIITLVLTPCLLIWAPVPEARDWMNNKNHFASLVVKFKTPLFITVVTGLIFISLQGKNLQWTSKMFDDLPKDHETRVSTEYIGNKMGGVIPLEISISAKKSTWENPSALHKLDNLVKKWRLLPEIGSVISISDFIKVADPKLRLPKHKNSLSEIYLVYGMSNKNPLRNFLTPNRQGTRVSFKLRDVPANQMQIVVNQIKENIIKTFPNHEILVGGLAATVHPLNESLSKDLMLGFFHAMIGIMIILSLVFRSLKWAIVSALPNLIPPAVLLGTLAITETPIKPGIAIIFAISLGIAFDNTVYILGRLKEMLKEKTYDALPVKELLSHEAGACFVSSVSLLCGFSIFLFSYFSMNKIFGLFMLLSITAGLVGDLILLPIVLKMFPHLLLRKKPAMILKSTTPIKSGGGIVRSALGLLLIGTLSVLLYSQSLNAKTDNSAESLLKKVKALTSPPNETAEIEMTIIEPDGSKKSRNLTIMRKNSDSQKALVRIQKPSDLRGVSLLSISDGDKDDQWLYLPSSKRSRRIVGSGKTGKFLDSELSYEDMSASTYNQFKNQILKNKKPQKKSVVIVESLAKPNAETSYAKIHTHIDKKLNRIEKVEYFNKSGKIEKTMAFSKYKKIENKFWRAGHVKVKNLVDNRGTILELKSVNLKRLNDDQFSTTALE